MATIQSVQEFEERLDQLCRFYRAMHEIWSKTNSADNEDLTRWVTVGGSCLEKLTEVLADIEEYAGCGELRIIWDQLKTMRAARDQENLAGKDV